MNSYKSLNWLMLNIMQKRNKKLFKVPNRSLLMSIRSNLKHLVKSLIIRETNLWLIYQFPEDQFGMKKQQ